MGKMEKETKSKAKNFLVTLLKGLKFLLSIIFAVIMALGKSLTVDLFKNTKLYVMMSINKEEREKIRKQLENEKRIGLIEDKLKSIERLLYAVFKDPKYIEKPAGSSDLKQLAKSIKK